MLKVLIIEDDELLREQLARGLADSGFSVGEADSGAAGLRLYHETAPDVVVTDIIMDEGEGLGAIMELRRVQPDLPIVVMSGNPTYLDYGLKLGASEGLLKPFTMQRLRDAIGALAGAPVGQSG